MQHSEPDFVKALLSVAKLCNIKTCTIVAILLAKLFKSTNYGIYGKNTLAQRLNSSVIRYT